MSAETKAPNALPAHVVSAINDYGITCANVVKKRTSPECENWAREKLEDAIRLALTRHGALAQHDREGM